MTGLGRRDMRKFDRRPFETTIIVRAADRDAGVPGLQFGASNVSEGGAFLRSDFLFEVGEVLKLEIPLPSGRVISATGRVVRVARNRGREPDAGMGVEFSGLSLEDRRAIAAGLHGPRPDQPHG